MACTPIHPFFFFFFSLLMLLLKEEFSSLFFFIFCFLHSWSLIPAERVFERSLNLRVYRVSGGRTKKIFQNILARSKLSSRENERIFSTNYITIVNREDTYICIYLYIYVYRGFPLVNRRYADVLTRRRQNVLRRKKETSLILN